MPMIQRVIFASACALSVSIGVAWTFLPTVSMREPDTGTAHVLRVLDGDSFAIKMLPDGKTEQIRLIGINTPEIRIFEASECYAYQARARLEGLIEGKDVSLMFDQTYRDKYNRILAYAWVLTLDGYVDIGALMVSEGYARSWTLYPNIMRSAYYQALDREARRLKVGRWGDCPV